MWNNVSQCDATEIVMKDVFAKMSQLGHASREAACHCLADMCAKTGELFLPFAAQSLEALKSCLEDELWTTREAAILAASAIVEKHPSTAEQASTLTDALFQHLSDGTYNVRTNAAKAICVLILHTPDSSSLQTRTDQYLSSHLLKAKE